MPHGMAGSGAPVYRPGVSSGSADCFRPVTDCQATNGIKRLLGPEGSEEGSTG